MKRNNYAFIDSQNVNLAIQDQGWYLSFKKFRIYLEEKYHVRKAFLFIEFISKNQSLYTQLQEDGYILIFKPTLILPTGTVKGNVDADLVLHAMIEYPHYDQAILVTGDGDFYCLVEFLNKKNKLGKLLIPNKNKYSGLLKPFGVDKIAFMTDLREKLGEEKGRQVHKD